MSDYALDAAKEIILPRMNGKDPNLALIAAKCLGLMIGYHNRWKDAQYLIDDVEVTMTSDLFNPETQRKSRSFKMGGKIDVRATEIETGYKVIFDHKTTSDSIEDPAGDYWKQLVVEGQASHYLLLEHLNGVKVDRAIWDVIKKPGIAPKLLSKADKAEVMKESVYFGSHVSSEELEELADTGRETFNMYSSRLNHDCTVERPQAYFQRRPIPRLDSEMIEYAKELWTQSQYLLSMRKSGQWPRISKACMLHHSACRFLPICSGHDSPDSGNWNRKEWVHPELNVIGDNRGVDLLTNSRLQTLVCPKKHYFQYELGLEKLNEEEKEALYFGNLKHEALEQYFLALRTQQQKGTATTNA